MTISTEYEETSLNDKDEMHANGGNGNGRKVDTTGKHDGDKGNIFDNMKRQSSSNTFVVECVDNNDTDMEETFENPVTYVYSQTIIVDDAVTK